MDNMRLLGDWHRDIVDPGRPCMVVVVAVVGVVVLVVVLPA